MNSTSPSCLRYFRVRFCLIPIVALSIASGVVLGAIDKGSSYASVVAEKGQPASKLQRGDTMVLTYPDMVIKLQAGAVVSITAAVKESTVSEMPAKPAAGSIAPGQWTTDYLAALAQAKAQHCKALLLFTGSDWCPWCIRLEKEILSTPAFLAFARSNLVLVKLDFPRSIPQPAQLVAQNQKLQRQYGIGGYPTVIVLNGDGKAVGELGYQPGGPGPFIGKLKGL